MEIDRIAFMATEVFYGGEEAFAGGGEGLVAGIADDFEAFTFGCVNPESAHTFVDGLAGAAEFCADFLHGEMVLEIPLFELILQCLVNLHVNTSILSTIA